MKDTPQDPQHCSEDETAALLEDIRAAEDQIARGEGIDHGTVKALLLARFGRGNAGRGWLDPSVVLHEPVHSRDEPLERG